MNITLWLPSLEKLFGDRLSNLTERHFQTLVDDRAEEDSQLDFKQTLQLDTDKDRKELAKDVCAFANARGGLLVYGIAEENGRAAELKPFDRPAGEIRSRIASILRSHCRPAPSFQVTEVEAEHGGRIYIALAVPRSLDARHALLRKEAEETWLQFPVRYEDTTTYLSEPELALR